MINSLKILNLSYCYDLTNSPDFWQLPNLEELILKGCINLVGLHESIGKLESLLLLNLMGCKNLRQLPMKIFQMKSLVVLTISGCLGLKGFSFDLGKMESLRVFLADGINQSSSSSPKSFRFSFVSLPHCLVTLNLSDCNLSRDHIPQNLVDMCMLRELVMSRNPIYSLPELPMSLGLLLLDGCNSLEMLTNLPNHPSGLSFYAKGCKRLAEVQGLFKSAPVDSEMVKELGLTDLDSNVILQQPAVINLLTDNLYYHEAPVLQFTWMFMEELEARFSLFPLIDMCEYTKRKGYRDLLRTEFAKKLFMSLITKLATEFAEEWELEAQEQRDWVAARDLPGYFSRHLRGICHAISRACRASNGDFSSIQRSRDTPMRSSDLRRSASTFVARQRLGVDFGSIQKTISQNIFRSILC